MRVVQQMKTLHIETFTRNVEPKIKVKGKSVPVLFLTEHHAVEVYWEMEV
jgi:hypothetical protein